MAGCGKVDFSSLQSFVNKVESELGSEEKVQEFIDACAKELAARLLTKVIRRTPVGEYDKPVNFTTKDGKEVSFQPHTGKVGGTLRRGWTGEKQQDVQTYVNTLNIVHSGENVTIEIINPVEYASYVEYGHRTKNHKGWVEGKFMLTISVQEIQQAAPGVLESKLKRKLGEVFG